jgi:small-conductance mechanosensitive channel
MAIIREDLMNNLLIIMTSIIIIIIVLLSLIEPMVEKTMRNETVFNMLYINLLLVAFYGYYSDNLFLIQSALITSVLFFLWILICFIVVLFGQKFYFYIKLSFNLKFSK